MLGMGQEGEMAATLAWFEEQSIANPNTSYNRLVNDGNVCTGIFYMSAEMKSSLQRNGQFIMIDATCKTNRFGMPLVILAGSNEIHRSAIFAIGLIMTESIDMYKWLLGECKKAAGQLSFPYIHSSIYFSLDFDLYLAICYSIDYNVYLSFDQVVY
jgi:hypothetical protein